MPDGSSQQHPLSPIGHNAAPTADDALAVIRATLLDPDAAGRSGLATSLHAILLDLACSDEPSRAAERVKLETAIKRWDAERPDIETDEQNAKAVDCAARLAAHLRIEDNARTAAKRPYLDGGKRIDAAFKARTAPLDRGLGDNAARTGMRGRLIRYQDRRAAIAAAPKQTRTDHGALATIQTRYRVEITDPAALPRKYLIPDIACIKAVLEAGQDIPGARLVPETGVVLR